MMNINDPPPTLNILTTFLTYFPIVHTLYLTTFSWLQNCKTNSIHCITSYVNIFVSLTDNTAPKLTVALLYLSKLPSSNTYV